MSVLKPFMTLYKSYTGDTMIVTFKCVDCGSDKCFRPKRDYHYTFFEGFYICMGCKKHIDYADDDFTPKPYNKQLELFTI